MKNLLIVSGNLGSTLSAARQLQELLGDADLYDTKKKRTITDFSQYDNFIFGTNVRMFRLNRRFKSSAKRLRKYYRDKSVFCYILGGDESRAERYQIKAAKLLKSAVYVRYAGGLLDERNAKGFERNVIAQVKKNLCEEGKPLPEIRGQVLREIAGLILNSGGEGAKKTQET